MNNFVIVLIVLVGAIVLWRLYVHGKNAVIEQIDLRRKKKVVTELKQMGPLFCANIKGDVIAVCTLKAFKKAIADYNKKVGTEGGLEAWRKVTVYVHPTFTFAGSEQSLRPAHTGKREDLEEIIKKELGIMFGKNDRLFSGRQLEELAKFLIQKDSRLYVPFIGDEYQKEWADYKDTDLSIAQATLRRKWTE